VYFIAMNGNSGPKLVGAKSYEFQEMNDAGDAASHAMAASDLKPQSEPIEQVYDPDEKDKSSLGLNSTLATAAASAIRMRRQ
jgi:hypothetical protein